MLTSVTSTLLHVRGRFLFLFLLCVSPYKGGVRADLRGSAVCTSLSTVWVFGEELIFTERQEVDRHDCPLDEKQGYADMAGVLLLFLLLFVLGKAQDKAAEYTDTQVGRRQ